jgi:hypothetical protein
MWSPKVPSRGDKPRTYSNGGRVTLNRRAENPLKLLPLGYRILRVEGLALGACGNHMVSARQV